MNIWITLVAAMFAGSVIGALVTTIYCDHKKPECIGTIIIDEHPESYETVVYLETDKTTLRELASLKSATVNILDKRNKGDKK